MFGLVRVKRLKELEAENAELRKKLEAQTILQENDDIVGNDIWSKARAGLLEAAKRDPSPENLKKVDEALHYLNRIAKSERNARYYAEHKTSRKRKKSRFSPQGLNEADGSALHDVFDMGSITFSHDLLALKKPLKGKGL